MSPKTEKPMALGIGSGVVYVALGGPLQGHKRPPERCTGPRRREAGRWSGVLSLSASM